MKMEHHKDLIAEAVKSAPPLTVTTLTLFGVPLQQWVYVLTVLWLFMQIGGFTYDRYQRWKRGE